MAWPQEAVLGSRADQATSYEVDARNHLKVAAPWDDQ